MTRHHQLQIERAQERKLKAALKADQDSSVEGMNKRLVREIQGIQGILKAALKVDDFLDIDSLKEKEQLPRFQANHLLKAEVSPQFIAPSSRGLLRVIPGMKGRLDRKVEAAKRDHERALQAREAREKQRSERLAAERARHKELMAEARTRLKQQHGEIEEFKTQFRSGHPSGVVKYFALVLSASKYPDSFPRHTRTAYSPESKQLVVEYDFPEFKIIPEVKEHKSVKSGDGVKQTMRSAAERKALYSSLLAQIALRTIHEIFEADRTSLVETIVFNGHVNTIDRATGKKVRPCLITLRTSRPAFSELKLAKVEPVACLKKLNAGVSKNPEELSAVRPVLEFSMVDPRYIKHSDLLAQLDSRPNLMALTPSEFETLITNLFEKMGLETRLTQASRDGGVDCVAYDNRPIFGGKVVIQAKRYKNTVGVSAVRDLFGTVQNEGASKGILVTTSGYGSASYDFANNKPLELLDGSNLLYLLAEHAGIEAKIEPPEDWVDPVGDIPGAL